MASVTLVVRGLMVDLSVTGVLGVTLVVTGRLGVVLRVVVGLVVVVVVEGVALMVDTSRVVTLSGEVGFRMAEVVVVGGMVVVVVDICTLPVKGCMVSVTGCMTTGLIVVITPDEGLVVAVV